MAVLGWFRKAQKGEPLRDALDVDTWNRIIDVLMNIRVVGGSIDKPSDGTPWKIDFGGSSVIGDADTSSVDTNSIDTAIVTTDINGESRKRRVASLCGFSSASASGADSSNIGSFEFLARKNKDLSYVTLPISAFLDHVVSVSVDLFDRQKTNFVHGKDAYWVRYRMTTTDPAVSPESWSPIFHIVSLECTSGNEGTQGEVSVYDANCWLGEDFKVSGIRVYNGKDATLFGTPGVDNYLSMYVSGVTVGTGATTLTFLAGGSGTSTTQTLTGNIYSEELKKALDDIASIRATVARMEITLSGATGDIEDLKTRVATLENDFQSVRDIAQQAADALVKIPQIEQNVQQLGIALSQTNTNLDNAVQTLTAGIVQNAQSLQDLDARVKKLEGGNP